MHLHAPCVFASACEKVAQSHVKLRKITTWCYNSLDVEEQPQWAGNNPVIAISACPVPLDAELYLSRGTGHAKVRTC